MNAIAARQNFEIAREIFAAQRMDLQKIRLTQSTLRMEQPLTANQNLYTFPVLVNIQNQAQPFPTEIRLQQQDSFVITEVGIFLALSTGTTDTTFQLKTYTNPFVFTNATQMTSLYNNGVMKLMIDNDQWINNWDLWRHWYSPETQATAAPGANSPIDQFMGADYGWYPMQPFTFLTGAQNIELTIRLNNQAPTAVDANSRLIIMFRGVLAQNSTVIR